MDESKKVERELVAIQERQVHHQLDNSIKIDDEKSTRMWKLMMIMMNTIMMIACKSFVSFLMFTPQAAGDIYIHSLLTDLQTAETEGAELQVTIKTWLEWSFTDQDYHPTTLTSASSTGSWPCPPRLRLPWDARLAQEGLGGGIKVNIYCKLKCWFEIWKLNVESLLIILIGQRCFELRRHRQRTWTWAESELWNGWKVI